MKWLNPTKLTTKWVIETNQEREERLRLEKLKERKTKLDKILK